MTVETLTFLQMSSSKSLGTRVWRGSLPLFSACISALRRAWLRELFPYSRLWLCSFMKSTFLLLLSAPSTDLLVFSVTAVVTDLETDLATDLATELVADVLECCANCLP